ncbi:MAG: VWA domain-containing protein [Phycisphaerae bacterium]|jgi:Flp pilus assembly protein TadG
MERSIRTANVRFGAFRRRGAVIVQTALGLTVIMGFAALSVDVGSIYRVRAELQRTADAAALAAVAELGNYASGDPMGQAKTVAAEYAAANKVLGEAVQLAPEDVTFGRAYISDQTGKYVFEATEENPNAIRVKVRRTTGSPNGGVPLFFGTIFGKSSVDVSATATAVLTPRDIVFVLDLSASHNDDSSLVHYRLTDVNLRPVWAHLWDTTLAPQPYVDGQAAGPSFGNMNAWGTDTVGPDWDFANDPGLVRLKRGTAWSLTSAWVSQTLSAKGYGTYTAAEMSVINSATGAGTETSTSNSTQKANYRRRIRVALGIDRWKSGKPGGQPGGNGDNVIDASEVVNMIPYPSSSSNPATNSRKIGGSWDGFIDYVTDISKSDSITSDTGLSYRFLQYDPSSSYYGNPDLRWRFGLKLLTDYIQDRYPANSSSPGLAGAPEQPMGAVSDAVKTAIDIIKGLEGNDLVGMVAYGTQSYGPADKPGELSWLVNDLDGLKAKVAKLQAGMWSNNTNIAQGIDEGVDVLFNSPNQRPNAAKIMLLLTDGIANQTRNNPTQYNETQAKADTLAAAADARNPQPPNAPVRIYTISVGADADQDLMEQVAQIGKGEHFHAGGDVSTYQATLQQIFQKLGGKRPVALIE